MGPFTPFVQLCKVEPSEARHPRKGEEIQLQKSLSHSLHQPGKPCSYSPIRTPASVRPLHEIGKFLRLLLTPGLSESCFWDSQPHVTGKGCWTPRSSLYSPNQFAGCSYAHATHQTNRDESVEEVVENKSSYISYCCGGCCYCFQLHVDFEMELPSISLHHYQTG